MIASFFLTEKNSMKNGKEISEKLSIKYNNVL